MKRFLLAVATALLRAWYHLCRLSGVRRRIVCLSRQSDEDSLDFLLVRECVARTHPGYEVVILARALTGKLGYAFHMLKQVYFLATSEAVLLDSYCIAVSLLGDTVRAPVVQLWHSLGNLKRFGWAALGEAEGRSPEEARLWHMHEGYDSILISSFSFANEFAASFGADPGLLYEAPLPRCDLLVDSVHAAEQRAAFHEALPATVERKNIVYAPTLRRAPSAADRAAVQALVDAVDHTRYNLIYQRHPVSALEIDDPRVITAWPAGLNPLYVADCVVSDYSTIIYEAGLLDLPVYLYAYDGVERSRSLTIDLARDVPAPLSTEAADVVTAIEAEEFDHATYRAFTEKNVALPAVGSCTERVVAHVFDLMARGKCSGAGAKGAAMAERVEGAAVAAASEAAAPAAAPSKVAPSAAPVPAAALPETAAVPPAAPAPLVTVGVPVHNGAEFLPECLDSVLAQTLVGFELICVDDGSTDATPELLVAYAERDPRVRVVQQEASGVSAARNRVLDLARGRYLLYLDADDWLEPVALEHLAARLEADGADVAVCANRNYDMRTGALTRTTTCLIRKQVPDHLPFTPEENLKYLYTFGSFNVWNKMLRVSMLREHGLRFRPFRVSQDSYFCAELLLAAGSITVVDECLHYYRIGNAGSTIGAVSADILAGYRVLVEIKRMLVERGRYEGELKQCYINKALSQSLYYLRKAATREALAEWRDFMCAQGFADLDVLGHDAAYFYSAGEYKQLQVVLASESGDDLAFTLYQQMELDRDRQRVARNRYQVEAEELRREKRRLEVARDAAVRERDRARSELERIKGSKSWKIAQGIRGVATALRVNTKKKD